MKYLLPAMVFAFMVTLTLPATARKWTSNDGRFSTDAELVEADDENVTLKKKSGEVVTVPIQRLSGLDRHYLASAKKKLPPPKKNVPSYVTDVQPFLSHYCAQCHNAEKPRDGFDVTTYAALTRSGKKGALVVPGKSAESRLIATMEGNGKRMPPAKSPQPTPEEIAKVTAWINAGAQDDTAAPPASKSARPTSKASGKRS
jgi:hypothetical protein